MKDIKTIEVVIKGKVQGVFFRASTKEKAQEIGVTGWVRNEENGSVRVEMTGEEAQLEKMLKWLNQGPEQAEVNSVEYWELDLKKYNKFGINR